MIGGAPFVRWASQPGVEVIRLDARRLDSYIDHHAKASSLDTNDFEALSKIPRSEEHTSELQSL